MKDRQDMTDEEHRLQDARECAALAYRAARFHDYATEVELGEHDDCGQMRVAQFFIEPPQSQSAEFIAAFDEAAARSARWLLPNGARP